MTIGLDCNILVQLAMEDHHLHERSLRAFDREAGAAGVLKLVPLVATEFLHVVTDGRRFDLPLDMATASNWLQVLMGRPQVEVVEAGADNLQLTLAWLSKFQLGRKRVLDTLLAATLHGHGVRCLLTSNPDDFRIFGVFKLIVP